MKKPAIIVDLDGTLCNVEHRQRHLEGKRKDWKAFANEYKSDTINEWCRTIIYAMGANASCAIILLTGRNECYRRGTEEWLQRNGVPYSFLLMRQNKDFRADSIIKKEIYEKHIEPNHDVIFCIDDRQQVVDMWRSLGLTCLQCAKGDF